MSPPTVMRIFSGNSNSLRTAKQRFVLCMHIVRFTQFFQLTTNYKNLASTRPGTSNAELHTSVYAVRIHHTLPWATDYK